MSRSVTIFVPWGRTAIQEPHGVKGPTSKRSDQLSSGIPFIERGRLFLWLLSPIVRHGSNAFGLGFIRELPWWDPPVGQCREARRRRCPSVASRVIDAERSRANAT